MHTVRELCDVAFGLVGLDWERYVRADERYLRPTDVDQHCGDASKAAAVLGWRPTVASRPDGQPRRALDTSRARARFGFEARTSFRDGLWPTVETDRLGQTRAAAAPAVTPASE